MIAEMSSYSMFDKYASFASTLRIILLLKILKHFKLHILKQLRYSFNPVLLPHFDSC